ncbi:hypothetical protein BOTBODRAFT_59723 [Botryobasidium botryosum FD-172 SS1]|uniref:Uncharacterized protein n=1 Tax=Botryobasidium botryosum (strain FD-172 SS1) TaxID=930990 RepID=A0A067M892_BOTB1|nr:hypothetical protein BOTBODRAFT_59723 [Botryobasidium botryosum FD-172 SS1]
MPIIAAPILAMDFTPKVVSHNNRLVWSDEMASHIGSERRFIDSLPAVTSATKHTDAVLKIGMLLGVFQGPIGAALAATLAADELIRTEGRGDENPRSIFPCSEEVFCGLRQFVEPRLVRFLGSTDAEDLREAVNEERAKANLEEITRDHMEGVADDFRRWFGK